MTTTDLSTSKSSRRGRLARMAAGLGLAAGLSTGALVLAGAGTAFAGSNGQQVEIVDLSGDPMQITLSGLNQYGQQTTQTLETSGGTIYDSGWWWTGTVQVQEFDYNYGASVTVHVDIPVSQSSDWDIFNAAEPTNLSVAASAGQIVAGQPVTFTATASQLVADTPPPDGTVTFEQYNPVDGTSTSLGSASLLDGSASLAVSDLAAGDDDVYATYSGGVSTVNNDYAYLSSQSANLVEVVEAQIKTATLSASSLTFGNRVVGHTASKIVTLTNTGNVPWAFSGASTDNRAVNLSGSSTCFTTTVAPRQTCGFTVLFDAQSVGATTGHLYISDNFGELFTLTVTGTGVAKPSVTGITPTSGPAAGGTTVTITGTNLVGITHIHVGPLVAKTFSCPSATTCTVVTPPDTGIRAITVTNKAGTSAKVPGDRFRYVG